ncbi:hypothetical protein [Rhodosalinus sp.]|uniref:hypothetical protein n=1 Tax=Rhodosalinus sp. TaxID=2047741 RepID=UPI0035652261
MKTTIASAAALLIAASAASAMLPSDQDHPRHGATLDAVEGAQVQVDADTILVPRDRARNDGETVGVTSFEGNAASETPR